MKVGVIGCNEPNMGSLLQAYALKKFFEENKIDYFYINDHVHNKSGVRAGKKKNTFLDQLMHRTYKEPSSEKAKEAQELFFSREPKSTSERQDADCYIIADQRAVGNLNGKTGKKIEYFQSSFEKTERLQEALLLTDKTQYEAMVHPAKVNGDFIFLDCESEKSPLIRFARKVAKQRGYQVISLLKPRKYYEFEQNVEVYDPREYLGFIQDAKMVITDSFATSYLAILFEKEVVAADTKEFEGKNLRLLAKIRNADHYYGKRRLHAGQSYDLKDKELVKDILWTMRTKAAATLLEELRPEAKEYVDCPTGIKQDECCGCYACEASCPVHAITMKKDAEGFYYPHVNDACIHCNLCAKVCIKKEEPQHVVYEKYYPKVFCAINEEEDTRFMSTSGGSISSLGKVRD